MNTARQGFELRGETTPIPRLVTELWRSRSLIRALARRDFFVRYRRPSFGAIWSIVVPLMQAVVLSVVFSKVIRLQALADIELPFILFMLSGVVPWQFFASTLGTAVRSITGGSSIASKVYFPRAVLPLSSVGTSVYGYLPSFIVLIGTAIAWRVPLRPSWLLLIPASVLLVCLTSAFSLVLAALQVYFRDVAFILTAVLQAWFYASAVFFPVTLAPKGILRTILVLNPATGMVDMFRAAFVGLRPYTLIEVCSTVVFTLVLTGVAMLLYRRYDRVFVDLL